MQIIPVIDLKAGVVVHAVRGDRQYYRPIHHISRLTAASDPRQVIAALLALHPFQRFYLADLDAIQGLGSHDREIGELLAAYPQLEFWVDNGCRLTPGAALRTAANQVVIIGTESQPQAAACPEDCILSLDYRQQATGDPAWFRDAGYWPRRLIVMTLQRVGSDSGPDYELLAELSSTHPDRQFIAAGGVRDGRDLQRLAAMGMHGVLLATALHQGRIGAAELGVRTGG